MTVMTRELQLDEIELVSGGITRGGITFEGSGTTSTSTGSSSQEGTDQEGKTATKSEDSFPWAETIGGAIGSEFGPVGSVVGAYAGHVISQAPDFYDEYYSNNGIPDTNNYDYWAGQAD